MKPTIITLSPRQNSSNTVRVATFEEAFGDFSEARGRKSSGGGGGADPPPTLSDPPPTPGAPPPTPGDPPLTPLPGGALRAPQTTN